MAELTRPATARLRVATSAPAPPRPVASVARGLPFSATLETIQLLKERSAGSLRLYAVSFEDQDGVAYQWLIGAEEQEDGWRAAGGAGGGGEAPHRGQPWVNLAAWWGADRFCAGGPVLEAEDVCSVRLTTRDAVVIDDDTAGGVALFLANRSVELPVVLELRDSAAATVATQMDLDVGDRR